MAGSPCGLATDCNPLKRTEMALCYSSLLLHKHTRTHTFTCVLTHKLLPALAAVEGDCYRGEAGF